MSIMIGGRATTLLRHGSKYSSAKVAVRKMMIHNPVVMLIDTRPCLLSALLLPSSSSFSTSTNASSSSSTSPSPSSPLLALPPVLPSLENHVRKVYDVTDGLMKTEQIPNEKSLLTKLMDRFSITGQQNRIRIAEAYYQACTRQAADPRWYGPGRIPRDFRNRHAMLTMHIWFLHKRLISDRIDSQTARLVQKELFNILWEDTACRIRQLGVRELAMSKHLKQVTQYTLMHLTHYDKVYTNLLDKPSGRLKELRKIVWRHILVRDPKIMEAAQEENNCMDQLNRIAWYIEANYQNILMDLPDKYYRQGRIAWVDLPDFSNMQDANGNIISDDESCPVHPDDILPAPWLKNITLKGIDYYWNPETMESSWERPLG